MAEFFNALVMIVLAASSIVMWRRIYNAAQNGQPHCLLPRESKIPPLGFLDVLAAIAFTISSQVFAVLVAMLLTAIKAFDSDDIGPMTVINISAGTAQLIAAGLTLWYLFYRYGDSRAAGLKSESIAKDLKLGFYAFLLFVPPMLLLQAVLTIFWEYEHPTMELISPESSLLEIVSAWWTATIVAPISEEVLFRVVLLGWLMRCFAYPNDFLGGLLGGISNNKNPETEAIPAANHSEVVIAEAINSEEVPPSAPPSASPASAGASPTQLQRQESWAPVFIVSLLFALVHIGQGPAPISIFFLALALGYLYRQTGSVIPCITIHFLLNTFSMTVFTVGQLVFPEEESLGEEGLAAPAGIVDLVTTFF